MSCLETPDESYTRLSPPEHDLAYYTVSDAAYFVGAVALLNSLRRVDEQAPLYVVDCGLTDSQRKRLSTCATVVPRYEGLHPQLQKATGPLAHPAKVMVSIDADILVTRPLGPLLSDARAGRIVGFVDSNFPDRFFDAWSSSERGTARHRPYMNSGFLVFSWETAERFLPLFVKLQRNLDMATTHLGGGSPSDPAYFPDQDLLNALCCTSFDGRVTRLDARLAPFPPFDRLTLTDGQTALCTYPDAVAPFTLHHVNRKPWLAPLPATVYSRLFTMLVTDRQACLRLDAGDLPLRLSDHPFAWADRIRARAHNGVTRRVRELGNRPKVARLRARLAG